jgi:hypothetical protein
VDGLGEREWPGLGRLDLLAERDRAELVRHSGTSTSAHVNRNTRPPATALTAAAVSRRVNTEGTHDPFRHQPAAKLPLNQQAHDSAPRQRAYE